MCKLFIATKIKNKKLAGRLGEGVIPYLGMHDRDGFGCVYPTKEGVEWSSTVESDFRFKNKEKYKKSKDFNIKDIAKHGFYVLHSRWATCEKGIKNTHPMHVDNYIYCHNGVIRNHEDFNFNGRFTTSCDSEAIGWSLHDSKGNLSKAYSKLIGYAAIGLIDTVHRQFIVANSDATLHKIIVKDVGEFYVTQPWHLIYLAKAFGLKIISDVPFEGGVSIDIDSWTTKRLEKIKTKSQYEVKIPPKSQTSYGDYLNVSQKNGLDKSWDGDVDSLVKELEVDELAIDDDANYDEFALDWKRINGQYVYGGGE